MKKYRVLRTSVGPRETEWSDVVFARSPRGAVEVTLKLYRDTRNAIEIVKHVGSGRLFEVRR